jgi:outer membrane lipoprotein-sorting protein
MTNGNVRSGPAGYSAGPGINRTSSRLYLILVLSAFACLCVIFSPTHSANGYVLPGQHLLLLMTENLGSASGLSVHQRTFLYNGQTPEPATESAETLSYRFSDGFRSESTSPDSMRIHVDTLDAAVTILDGRVALQNESRYDRYKDLLLFHSRILLQERLLHRGIDTMVSSLGRFDGIPVYVLGAQYPDMTAAQVWIDKESLRPIRLLIPMTDGAGAFSILEFRYLFWQKNGKLWYPMRIECYEGEQLVREMIVEDMTVNPLFADGTFDIGRLKTLYWGGGFVEEDLGASGAQGDIENAVEDFGEPYE